MWRPLPWKGPHLRCSLRLFAKCKEVLSRRKDQFPGRTVRIYGFIEGLHSLMSSADVDLSKAGASTFTELLHLKKTQIVVQRIYGQEQGNLDFLQDHQVGFYSPGPQRACELVRILLEDPAMRSEIAQRIDQLSLRNGTDGLSDWVVSQPRQKPTIRQPDILWAPLKTGLMH